MPGEHRLCLAIHPAGVERGEVALDAEDAVAMRTVALGPRHVVGKGGRNRLGAAMPQEHLPQQGDQFVICDVSGHLPIRGQVSESR
jgi:hypothetical protein